MKLVDYSKYYIQGSDHYLIPKDDFEELVEENDEVDYTIIPNCDIKPLIDKYKTQQKEFIKYLEDEIRLYKNDIQNFKKDYKVYFSLINDLRVSKAKIEEILQKYKEIIGDDKE